MAARQGVLATIIAFAVIAAPAEATIRKGSTTDARSDTRNGGTAGHDIAAVAAVSDDAGGGAVAIELAATPAANGYPVGILGTKASDGSCSDPGVVFLGNVGGRTVSYAATGGTAKTGVMTVEGNTVTLASTAAPDPDLARGFDCAVAGISANLGMSAYYDESGFIPLAAEAPPAATPAPTPAAPAPTPAPTTATTPPVPVPKAAKLNVTLSGTPATIKRNRTMKLKLKVANAGAKKSAKITVSVAKARGLSVSKVKALKALDPAKSRTVTLKVKLSKQARTSTTLKVTVKAGKLKQSSSVLLKIGKAKKLPPKPTTPQTKKSPIVGTYWWRTVTQIDYAWDNRALYFVDGAAVYSGFPTGGLPATCTTPPQSPEDEFDTREGCLPYTFDEQSGAVTIGDKAGTFAGGKLTIDGEEYIPLQIPEAGARFAFNEHRHFSFSGMCGMIFGCTTTQQYLSMGADGQFIWTRQSLTTAGDPGIGPWTAVGSYPPDQRGTYEVLAGGKIQLSYADGTVKVETFAVDTNRTTRQPDPLGEGVLIGEDNFYPSDP